MKKVLLFLSSLIILVLVFILIYANFILDENTMNEIGEDTDDGAFVTEEQTPEDDTSNSDEQHEVVITSDDDVSAECG